MRHHRRRTDAPGTPPPLTPHGREWTLQCDDLSILVRESTRRKTVELTVERDGQLLLLTPAGAPEERLRQLVESRRAWVYEKLELKRVQYRPTRTREYVPGEGFWYAGKTYRLKLAEGENLPALCLKGGWFQLRRDQQDKGRAAFLAWYTQHLREWLDDQLQHHTPRLKVRPQSVLVQDLGYRWGSCGRNHRLHFHWRVALLPRRIAEYVLMHELAHLDHPNHGPEFWARLETLLPDYQDRKTWLAQHGADYDL